MNTCADLATDIAVLIPIVDLLGVKCLVGRIQACIFMVIVNVSDVICIIYIFDSFS